MVSHAPVKIFRFTHFFVGFVMYTGTSYAMEGLTAFDGELIRFQITRNTMERWRNGPPAPLCPALLTFTRRLLGRPVALPRPVHKKQRPPESAPIAARLVPDAFTLTSKNQSNRAENRGKLFQLRGTAEGMLINGKFFPEFNVVYLPESKVPVAIYNPKTPAQGRIILLHGLGYSISTVYSNVATAQTLSKIEAGGDGDPFATWFANQYPDLRLPFQIVLMDLPPMGWSPSLEELPTAAAMAGHLEKVTNELDATQPLLNFFVSRSASAPLSILAGRNQAGVVITGGTFPEKGVLDTNVQEVLRLEREAGESPDWPLINELMTRFRAPELVRQLQAVSNSPLPVRSIVGSTDNETPWPAQVLWADLLGCGAGGYRRTQYVVDGAGHQVFRRPPSLPAGVFRTSDPDVQAFHALLDFLNFWSGE
jgi:hypothetical protein